MQNVKRILIALAALVVFVSVMPSDAQEPSGAILMAQGQLVKVDTDAKLIEIRTPANTSMSFAYTDETKVIGADENVAGLATKEGTQVSIHYQKQAQTNVAVQIDIQRSSENK